MTEKKKINNNNIVQYSTVRPILSDQININYLRVNS